MRHEHPVMVYGDYCPVMEEYEKVVAYTREYESEKWFMTFNFQDKDQQVDYAEGINPEAMQLLMGNYGDRDANWLKPYEGRIYRCK